MRKLSGLILVVLAVVVLVSMPSFKGLNMVQLDRANDLPVGPDPNGALGITGLDDGIPITIRGTAATAHREMGRITNNFAFPVQLTVTVEMRALLIREEGNPRWTAVNIFFDREVVGGPRAATLNFGVIGHSPVPTVIRRATGSIDLSPGATVVVSLDRSSRLLQINNIDSFSAEAFFDITGSRVGSGASSFTIRPVGDLRKQYFIRAN